LETFARLDALSKQPGMENDRNKLEGVIMFYRGANLAALGRRDESVEQFRSYLTFAPGARIEAGAYPKKVSSAFDEAVKVMARQNSAQPADIASVFAHFQLPPQRRVVSNEHWADGPVRYLLTSEEKARWNAINSTSERDTFVQNFWEKRDPTPGTPLNEFREEFDRRVLFSEMAFGSITSDRTLVFTLLGPPNFAKASSLTGNDNPIEALRNTTQGSNLGAGHQTNLPSHNLEQDTSQGSTERWVYRRDHLPHEIPYQEVEFLFITKKGYGTSVMQKDPEPLLALERAAAVANQNKKVN
ncbi:MAG: GWxTD domain-containing protein, partial [Acidobacteriota bacterium]